MGYGLWFIRKSDLMKSRKINQSEFVQDGQQGLFLVFGVMWLFFTLRYAFWVVMGLPVSFLASFYVLGHLGITINMISMVALLISLGILMDDAIVISESIGTQIKKGKKPMQAAIDGTKIVARGVISSFATTLCIFVGLIFIEGNIAVGKSTILKSLALADSPLTIQCIFEPVDVWKNLKDSNGNNL